MPYAADSCGGDAVASGESPARPGLPAGRRGQIVADREDEGRNAVGRLCRPSRYAFIYTDDVRPLLDRRVSVSVRSATIDELLSAVLKGTELTGRVRENQVIISKAPARKNAAVAPPSRLRIPVGKSSCRGR
mgnify:CR=1 FL=1